MNRTMWHVSSARILCGSRIHRGPASSTLSHAFRLDDRLAGGPGASLEDPEARLPRDGPCPGQGRARSPVRSTTRSRRSMRSSDGRSQSDGRRNLSESQRAMLAAKLADLEEGRPWPSKVTTRKRGVTQGDAAKAFGVGCRSVQYAKVVLTKGSEDLKSAVERGAVKVRPASSSWASSLAGRGP